MVSSSPSKKQDVGANSLNKSSVTLVPGPKPLKKHKFYLDVKNHITSSKLETKIKELGGLLELFLIKEVTHVVTDKEGWSNSTKGGGINPKTPQTPSNSSSWYNEHGTPDRTPRGRPKTRADAMLERARKTPTVVTKDPLLQAKSWGITIWTVDKASTWLEKVSLSVLSKKRKPAKIVELKAPYIKFEAFDRKHRPVFKEIRNWPSFNLRGLAGSTGLVHKTAGEQNMTRKSRAPPHQQEQPRIDAAGQPGYCEICRTEYQRLNEHLESKEHLTFIKDQDNFLELDQIINDGANIETFLKLNSTNDEKYNGSCSTLTPKMPRTRTSSICEKVKMSPHSPNGSELGHRLRTRRTATTNNYIGITADDDTPIKPEGAKVARELRSTQRNALLKLAGSDTWESGRPKRSCIKQKRVSAYDDRVAFETRSFYKIENSKRTETTKRALSPDEYEVEEDEEDEEEDDDDKSLIVKFRKMRSSELRQLNNEAENFLFPKKDDCSTSGSSDDEDVDGDGPDTTVSTRRGESSVVLTSENETEEDERSMDSNLSDGSARKKRKRLTHAEAFILDNKKYYKFETPGSSYVSRLRYQGSFMANVPPLKSPRSNGDNIDTKKETSHKAETKKKETRKKDKDDESKKKETQPKDDTSRFEEAPKKEEFSGKINLKEIQFSFERVPKSEPWYQTFSRQDQGEEYYTCFSDSGYWKPFLLPYEMGPIPPLDPKICISNYTQLKKQILEEVSSGSNSVACSTPDPCSNDACHNDPCSEDSNSRLEHDETESPTKRKKRKGILLPSSRNPRKSPRQHASTLAILSSIIQQRKKREINRAKTTSLEPIPEVTTTSTTTTTNTTTATTTSTINKDDVSEGVEDYEVVAKSIDDMLSGAMDDFGDLDALEISGHEDLNMKFKSDAIEILEDYENFKHVESKTGLASTLRRCYSPGKKPGRKKKKNRTGWPNKRVDNRRVKKEVVLDDNLEDSTLDSLSVTTEEDTNCNMLSDLNGDLGVKIHETLSEKIVNKNDQSVYNKNSSELDREDRVNKSAANNCTDIVDCVVDLDRWENAEKVLAAKISNKDLQFQPYVRVQKLDEDGLKNVNRRLRSSSSPHRTNVKRARRMPASPKSPRVLRKPRGKWYRER